MTFIVEGNTSFNVDAIKVIQRVKIGDRNGIALYINNGSNSGINIQVKFSQMLSQNEIACDITFNYIICMIIHKRSGLIRLERLIDSANKIYEEIIEEKSKTCIATCDIPMLKEKIISEYAQALAKMANSLL